MNEYEQLVEESWQAIQARRKQIEAVIGNLWDARYRYRYICLMKQRKKRIDRIADEWQRFAEGEGRE